MLFTGLGRSVLGETVPSAYGLGRYSRPRAQFLPIRTSQPVNNIYLLLITELTILCFLDLKYGKTLFTGLPVRPVIKWAFGRLRRKTASRGREDMRVWY